jgi:hypothetical protein
VRCRRTTKKIDRGAFLHVLYPPKIDIILLFSPRSHFYYLSHFDLPSPLRSPILRLRRLHDSCPGYPHRSLLAPTWVIVRSDQSQDSHMPGTPEIKTEAELIVSITKDQTIP